jgi:hypothetical protein
LALLQLFASSAYATFSGHCPFGVLNPTYELVSSKGCDVHPGVERRGVGNQRVAQIPREFVDDTSRDSLAAHEARVAGELENAIARHDRSGAHGHQLDNERVCSRSGNPSTVKRA